MSAHTPGPLTASLFQVYDNDGRPETAIQGLGGWAFVAVALDFGANNPGMRVANARRLVACWNACIEVETELLERHPAPFSVLRAERDALLSALEGLLAAVNVRIDDPRAEQFDVARAAVAKARGAA